MTTRRFFYCGLAGAGVLAISALAFAQSFNAKPGLWETTTTTTMGGMPMPAMPQVDTSKMTPEQAAAVAAAMGRMGGAPQTMTTRHCLTQEQIDKQMFQDKQDPSCKQTTVSKTATTMEVKVECTGQRAATGTVRITAIDAEHVKGAIEMTMGGRGRGAGMTMNNTFTSKWLGADCGDVK